MDWSYSGSLGFFAAVLVTVVLIWLPFNWRSPVFVRRQVFIKAARETVWNAFSFRDGDYEWHPHLRRVEEQSDTPETIRLHYELGDNAPRRQSWTHDMEVTDRIDGEIVRLQRLGLDQKNLNDRLLNISIELYDHPEGTEAVYCENWGPRSLAGRFIAHSDAAAVMSRLSSFSETGKACDQKSFYRGGLISALSALTTVAAFAVLLGLPMALVLVAILIIHELGHLVSFRMVGQPWGRIMFLPFIGGVAVSRMGHEKLSDDVFCALMGAGLSIVLLAPAAIYSVFNAELPVEPNGPMLTLIFGVAALAGAVNLLNLLPIFPLDGGRVVRAMVQSVAPDKVRHMMYALAGLIGGAALIWQNSILAALAVVAFFQSARLGPSASHIAKMDKDGLVVMGLVYAALLAAHGAALWAYLPMFIS